MSRAALWKQESNVREREQRADEIFQQAVAQGRNRSGVLPLWGSPDSFHLNPLLLRNTIKSPYFQKCCRDLSEWTAVIDEVYYEVKHLQPFSQDRSPSSAFCLLLRMLTLRMTEHQMDLTLNHKDSPYIRAIGFLYLRYAGPPERLYEFIRPFLQDDEMITVEQGHKGKAITVGEFVRQLFSGRDFYGTPLPRLPQNVERDVQVKMLQADQIAERAFHHHKNGRRMQYFETVGSKVMALYEDDENPLQWYEGVVDRVVTRDPTSGAAYKYPRFVVTFTEYGNTETVSLGEMDELNGRWRDENLGAHPGRGGRGYSHHGGRDGGGNRRDDSHDLYQQIRQRERDTVTADKGWARKPVGHRHINEHQRRARSVQDDDVRRPPPSSHSHSAPPRREPEARNDRNRDEQTRPEPRKRTAEEERALAEKRQKLTARYG